MACVGALRTFGAPAPLTLFVRPSMHLLARRFALALWLLSLVAPTCHLNNGHLAVGAVVALTGFWSLAFMFPLGLLTAPVLSASLLSNYVFVLEIKRQLKGNNEPYSLSSAAAFGTLSVLNLVVGTSLLSRHSLSTPLPFKTDLLAYPGFYLWVASFFLLSSAAIYDNWPFFKGLVLRSAAMGLMAATVFLVGFAVFFFSQ
jgi:hypothetical protein